MKSKKIIIIVITILVILAMGGGIFAYLFLATDVFKSDKELFSKYISQNTETFQKFSNMQTIQVYKDLKNKEKYELDSNMKITYSEGGEISNPFNNLSAKLIAQKDNGNDYFYADGQILFAEEEYLESELIKENKTYGIRFSDVAKQFVSIKDDENLDKVANVLDTDVSTLTTIIDIIDGVKPVTEEVITQDEWNELNKKYTDMIITAISNGTFSSNKKNMITYNNNTVNAKSYTVNISSQQVEELLVNILNNLKTETIITKNINDENFSDMIDEIIKVLTEEKEIPEVKITVYEKNKVTIRTVIEVDLNKIVIENEEINGEVKSRINISKIVNENTNEYNIEITKKTLENQENNSILVDVTEGEKNYSFEFTSNLENTDNEINSVMKITYNKDITIATVEIETLVDLTGEFEHKQELTEKNNMVLNDMNEEKIAKVIKLLESNVPLKVTTRIELLIQALNITNDETGNEVAEYEMTQTEINKFNAKFEFYTGEEVSAEKVKILLNIAKDNLAGCELTVAENQENIEEMKPEDVRYNIKLNIERNKTDENGINQALEKIKDDKKYKVSISYKEENKIIKDIVIEEVVK